MSAAKVAQRMIVDAHPGADPAIGRGLGAEPRDLARTVHACAQPIQPQRQQYPRVSRITSRAVLARLDRRTEPAQVEPFQYKSRAPHARHRPASRNPGLQYQLLTIEFPQPHLLRPSLHLRLSTIIQFPSLKAIPVRK
jgi:hypothetical protein